jgi:hypothetical protein
MTDLADAVLSLIRTRADLHRLSAANAHGRQMHAAVDLLDQAVATEDPATVFAVTQRALASAIKVIARADDSSGIIGDACRRLLDLHPKAAAAAEARAAKLVDWMMKFQFDGDVDYFVLDPVAYAPALGDKGIATYRTKLDELRAGLGPMPSGDQRWSSPHSHEWFTLEWNAQRLAVLDHDIEAIIRTHARDRLVAAWLEDTAEAFEEIGEIDLAIDWAKQATDFDRGHQSLKAAGYWCELLAAHRPAELLDARVTVFRRWPSSSTAAHLYRDAGKAWPDHRDEVANASRPARATQCCSPCFPSRTLHPPGTSPTPWLSTAATSGSDSRRPTKGSTHSPYCPSSPASSRTNSPKAAPITTSSPPGG